MKLRISPGKFESSCVILHKTICFFDVVFIGLPVNLLLSAFFPLFVYPLEPLPVSSVSIYDYKPSPETGVLFEIQYPEKYNVFTRVNISYWEGKDYRTMLYKGRKKLFLLTKICFSFLVILAEISG